MGSLGEHVGARDNNVDVDDVGDIDIEQANGVVQRHSVVRREIELVPSVDRRTFAHDQPRTIWEPRRNDPIAQLEHG
jgi:hypothetical protein